MRGRIAVVVTVAAALVGTTLVDVLQRPVVRPLDDEALREYVGVYRWDDDTLLYLQLLSEFTGANALTAIRDTGEVRVLFPTGRDTFFTGPGAAVAESVESRVTFQRHETGELRSLTWQRGNERARTAPRLDVERRDAVRFLNGENRFAGTLLRPATAGPHPAAILVHASGPATRNQIMGHARFLVRHGLAVFGYDKRGVGESTGDWTQASFDDLAGDVVAARAALRARDDIDPTRIGLLGWSQAGWVMPLAAVRAPDLAFLISISGAGVPAGETGLDHARAEMSAAGTPPDLVEQIVALMRLQYRYARTGEGWHAYVAARDALARLGPPPETMPATPDAPYWGFMRRLYFYDPTATLRRLRVPTLALFGELDNNILPDKNRAAWAAALRAGGHPDYTLRTLPRANHVMLEAVSGTNAESPTLRRIVPDYFTTILDWLTARGILTPPPPPEGPA